MKMQMLAAVGYLLSTCLFAADDYRLRETSIQLPLGAEKRLLEKIPASKITYIEGFAFRRLSDYEYFAVEGGFEVTWSFEGITYRGFILRKNCDDPDWSRAEIFTATKPVCEVLASPAGDLQAAVLPWKRPNKSLEPTGDR